MSDITKKYYMDKIEETFLGSGFSLVELYIQGFRNKHNLRHIRIKRYGLYNEMTNIAVMYNKKGEYLFKKKYNHVINLLKKGNEEFSIGK